MTLSQVVTATCDVCGETTAQVKNSWVMPKTGIFDHLSRNGWRRSPGQVPYKGADGNTYHRPGKRDVCPQCFAQKRHLKEAL